MKQMIDYEVAIKEFFQSAIRWLEARKPRDETERKQIAVAIARFRLLLQDPKKYTTCKELYLNFDKFDGMIIRGAKVSMFDDRVYFAAKSVLEAINYYYGTSTTSLFYARYRECLEKALKGYYVTISENVFKRAQYAQMLPRRLLQEISNLIMLQKISDQKTK